MTIFNDEFCFGKDNNKRAKDFWAISQSFLFFKTIILHYKTPFLFVTVFVELFSPLPDIISTNIFFRGFGSLNPPKSHPQPVLFVIWMMISYRKISFVAHQEQIPGRDRHKSTLPRVWTSVSVSAPPWTACEAFWSRAWLVVKLILEMGNLGNYREDPELRYTNRRWSNTFPIFPYIWFPPLLLHGKKR